MKEIYRLNVVSRWIKKGRLTRISLYSTLCNVPSYRNRQAGELSFPKVNQGGSVKTEEMGTKPRVGLVNFERRSHPRFAVDLPIEYYRIDSTISNTGRAVNSSEGGLLLYLPEKMEIGQRLRLKLFFASGSDLNTIETVAEVVWREIHLEKDRGDYRSGVKFIDISPEDLDCLKNFLRSLSE